MNVSHLQQIQNAMDFAVSEKKVSGLNVLIYNNNKEIAYFESGLADIKNNIKFKRNTICRLYSMTKPVTSVAAMILLQDGKLDLSDQVSKYIPSFADLKVCIKNGNKEEIKKSEHPLLIKDLLNMTSGYPYGPFSKDPLSSEIQISEFLEKVNKDCIGPCKITTQDVAQTLSKIPVSFEPGTDYCYGLSADILGAVIEKITGKTFGTYLKENIFIPLNMKDTDFYVPSQKYERLANVYTDMNGKEMKLFENPNLGIQAEMKNYPSFESGGAGLCSTIDDYMNFTNMLCNKGQFDGKQILLPKTVEYLATAKLMPKLQEKFDNRMPHLPGYSYCNLLRVAIQKGSCNAITEDGEFGWDGWLGPYMSVDLKNHLSIVMLMQRTDSGTWELTRKIKNIVYTSL